MLKAYLDYYRESIDLKCAGVAPTRLSERSAPPSTMTLHGLVRHLAGVERWWFAINFAGVDLPLLYYSDDDPDQDFESIQGDPIEALGIWRQECQRSREIVDAASSLDQQGAVARNGQYTSVADAEDDWRVCPACWSRRPAARGDRRRDRVLAQRGG
jgi:hypothetical protein